MPFIYQHATHISYIERWLAQLVRCEVSNAKVMVDGISSSIGFQRNTWDEMGNKTNLAHQPLSTSPVPLRTVNCLRKKSSLYNQNK